MSQFPTTGGNDYLHIYGNQNFNSTAAEVLILIDTEGAEVDHYRANTYENASDDHLGVCCSTAIPFEKLINDN